MAATISFSGQAPWQNTCFKSKAGLTLDSLPFKRSCPLKQNMNIQQHGIHLSSRAKNVFKKQRQYLVMSSMINRSNSISNPLSASDMIQQFYTFLNDKKLDKLKNYISESCYFEECSFPNALQGRKEVMQFYTQLAEGMGQNVKFTIEHVCEGDDHTVAVLWHLEWKNEQIPFTRGCSFYECSKEKDRLMIRKARIVIESPIKPGAVVLTLLKNVIALFDDFPKAAEWLLRSPHVIVNLLLKIYSIFLAPFINPIISGYLRMWDVMARLLGYIFKFVFYVLKIFLR